MSDGHWRSLGLGWVDFRRSAKMACLNALRCRCAADVEQHRAVLMRVKYQLIQLYPVDICCINRLKFHTKLPFWYVLINIDQRNVASASKSWWSTGKSYIELIKHFGDDFPTIEGLFEVVATCWEHVATDTAWLVIIIQSSKNLWAVVT